MIGVNGSSSGEYFTKGACQDATTAAEQRSVAEYYARSQEPAGQWITHGSNPLQLEGAVDPDVFVNLVDRLEHPTTGEPLGKRPYQFATPAEKVAGLAAAHPDATPEELSAMRINASRDSRHANHVYDITMSVQKSVSVLHAALERAGRQEEADEVIAAVWDGVHATMDYAARDLAYTRDQSGAPKVGGRATARYVHNDNWTAAAFLHHTSRDQDPQLHVHTALLNRVLDEDTGRWKTLYSPALTKSKHAMDAVFMRTVDASITRRTGHTFLARPDGVAREVNGVDPWVRDFFSTRSRAVNEGTKAMIDEFKATYGRDPSPRLVYKMAENVTLQSRNPKPEVQPTRAEELARWEAGLAQRAGGGLTQVLGQADDARVTAQVEGLGFDPAQVVAQVVADLDDTKSTFTRSNVYQAVGNRLPERLDHLSNVQIQQVMDELVDSAVSGRDVVSLIPPSMVDVPDELRDERGRFVFDDPMAERFATREGLAREDSLVARLAHTGGRAVPEADAQAALADRGLGDGQHRAAMGVLTGDKRTSLIVGPAGAGKSRMMDALDDANTQLNGAGVYGLTTAENAAQVLRAEGVSKAHNISRFLNYHERAAQGRTNADDDAEFAIPAGTVVVLDEAGTIPTSQLYDVMAILDRSHTGKVAMVGDPEQADAVDNAGAFALLVEQGDPYQLETPRRFLNDWERDATVQVRAGDGNVVHQYDTRDRVHGGTPEEMREAAVGGFLTDYRSGWDSIVVTGSQDEADQVASSIREQLVASGQVSERSLPLARGMSGGVSDRVQTRHNDRDLGVFNREMWTVKEVGDDGSMTVVRDGAERRLPASYVQSNVDLGYSGPVLAVQGRSVDRGHLLVNQTMGRSAVYPGLTRGREANHAYMHLTGDQTAVGRLVDAIETDDHTPAARTVLQNEMDRAENLGNVGHQWSMLTREHRAVDHEKMLREALGEHADTVLSDRASGGLFRSMAAAQADGRDPRAALDAAIAQGSMKGARSQAEVLNSRVERQLQAQSRRAEAASFVDRTPAGDSPRQVFARGLAEQMDTRRGELGEKAAREQPGWAAQLGPVPDDPADRAAWTGKAGWVAAAREYSGTKDETRAVGPQPPALEADRRWLHDKAQDALGVDREQRELEEARDGSLHNRVDQWDREQTWMPPNVDDRLRTAHRAHDEARQQAAERRDEKAQERVGRARERTETLEAIAAARAKAVEATRETRERARAAQGELTRRGKAPDRGPVAKPEPEQKVRPEPVAKPEREKKPEPVEAPVRGPKPARERPEPKPVEPKPAKVEAPATPKPQPVERDKPDPVEAKPPKPVERKKAEPVERKPEPEAVERKPTPKPVERKKAEPVKAIKPPEPAKEKKADPPQRDKPEPKKPDRDKDDSRDLARAHGAMTELARRHDASRASDKSSSRDNSSSRSQSSSQHSGAGADRDSSGGSERGGGD